MTFLLSVWSLHALSVPVPASLRTQRVVLLIEIISEFKFSVHVSVNDCERLPN